MTTHRDGALLSLGIPHKDSLTFQVLPRPVPFLADPATLLNTHSKEPTLLTYGI